ncbi:hypothetical protein BH10PSE7_BH10PSE7_31400 [soil metagenome]
MNASAKLASTTLLGLTRQDLLHTVKVRAGGSKIRLELIACQWQSAAGVRIQPPFSHGHSRLRNKTRTGIERAISDRGNHRINWPILGRFEIPNTGCQVPCTGRDNSLLPVQGILQTLWQRLQVRNVPSCPWKDKKHRNSLLFPAWQRNDGGRQVRMSLHPAPPETHNAIRHCLSLKSDG